MKKKHLCDCGKLAVWWYMPGYDEGENSFICDDCVHRGCSCNHYSIRSDDWHPPIEGGIQPTPEDGTIKWLDEYNWTSVDEQGREYPCCEYDYSKTGYDVSSWFSRKIIYSRFGLEILFFWSDLKQKFKKRK